jgi:hypothetical protein
MVVILPAKLHHLLLSLLRKSIAKVFLNHTFAIAGYSVKQKKNKIRKKV